MITETIDIWHKINKVKPNEFRATLDTYVLSGKKKRPAVLICPGGGYSFTSPREGEPVALQFNAAGFHAFVLNYSVNPNKHPQPLLDVSRAMCLIRENSDLWNVDNNKIAVCGFSAGGHLAASLGVHFNKPFLQQNEIHKGLNKPNALILCYPVITSGEYAHKGSFDNLLGKNPNEALLHELSLEKQVNKTTPPTFIWHTFEDRTVPVENTLLFSKALNDNNIPFELHIYPKGSHGLSLATRETAENKSQIIPHVATWLRLCICWLKNTL